MSKIEVNFLTYFTTRPAFSGKLLENLQYYAVADKNMENLEEATHLLDKCCNKGLQSRHLLKKGGIPWTPAVVAIYLARVVSAPMGPADRRTGVLTSQNII